MRVEYVTFKYECAYNQYQHKEGTYHVCTFALKIPYYRLAQHVKIRRDCNAHIRGCYNDASLTLLY